MSALAALLVAWAFAVVVAVGLVVVAIAGVVWVIDKMFERKK